VGHPTLGTAPVDFRAAYPEAAERLRDNTATISGRALEAAVDRDPTMTVRHDELSLRHLLRDTGVYLDRIAMCVASGEIGYAAEWADWCTPLYRRRRVPMDDLIGISEGLRRAVRAFLGPDEMAIADQAIDEAIRIMRWSRRIAGDARKRNWILQLLYKGA
jgi:hypothetical protein